MQSADRKTWRWEQTGKPRCTVDHLAVEEPLEIRVDTRPLLVTMRTPGHDAELAAGLMFAEGLIRRGTQIVSIRHYPRNKKGNVLDVFLQSGVTLNWEELKRHGVMASSCGLCGKTSIESVHRQFKQVTKPLSVQPAVLVGLPAKLSRAQKTFHLTGGVHAAGLFTEVGRLIVAREDVGRHNAVDKILGWGLLKKRLPWNKHLLLVSGRVSFEIMQKALAGRIPLVAAISAPSSLAVQFARDSGQTLVGFLRDGTMNIYAHPERIQW
jgi:FdhD protein